MEKDLMEKVTERLLLLSKNTAEDYVRERFMEVVFGADDTEVVEDVEEVHMDEAGGKFKGKESDVRTDD